MTKTKLFILTFAFAPFGICGAQSGMITKDISKDFGAIPNDRKNDQLAFEKAAAFINKRGGNVRLIIPKGKYIIGRQEIIKTKGYFARGINTLNISGCKNVIIEGRPGAILEFGTGFRFGTFDPVSGRSTNASWDCAGKVERRSSSQRAILGNAIHISNSTNVSIKNIVLDGSFYAEKLNNMNSFDVRCSGSKNAAFMQNKINLGGSYGGCGIQLAHYGIFINNSGNVKIENSTIRRFGTDGITVSNEDKDKAHANVLVNNCTIDHNARTGVALVGGNNIRITNNTISNTGRCVFISTGTGIDIEAEKNGKGQPRYVTDVVIDKNKIENNASGEILSRYGFGSSRITISNNEFGGQQNTLNMNSKKNKGYTISNNTFKGRKRVVMDGKLINATKTQQAEFKFQKNAF